jgi:hypothetical protein
MYIEMCIPSSFNKTNEKKKKGIQKKFQKSTPRPRTNEAKNG